MKNLLMLLVLCFVSTTTFADNAPSAGAGEPTWTHPQSAPLDDAANGYNIPGSESDRTCYAWTDCWSGARISCWATGDACRYAWRTGAWVYCEGYNYSGAWVSNTQYCY